jgi:Rieske Fe-S protein
MTNARRPGIFCPLHSSTHDAEEHGLLQTPANLAQVFGVVADTAAIGCGVAQIRQYRQQRRAVVA